MTDSELERLSFGQVIEMNEFLVAETGENYALLDPGGLNAALERPWSGFGDFEGFPTLYDKAAALLHGIASRQVFENGNKRTAWLAATTLLDINGIDLGAVETVHADMFVRAAGLDHSLDVPDLAEWFRVTHGQRRVGYATDPRVEYLALAASGTHADGLADLQGLHMFGFMPERLRVPFTLCVVFRIHWRPEDIDVEHRVTMRLEQTRRVAAPLPPAWEYEIGRPLGSGHPHHRAGFMPDLFVQAFSISLIQEGECVLVVEMDGAEVGRIPFKIALPLAVPEVLLP